MFHAQPIVRHHGMSPNVQDTFILLCSDIFNILYWLHNFTIDINYQCKLGVDLRTLHIVLCPYNRSDFLTNCQYRICLNNAQKYRSVFCIFWPPPIYIHSVPSPTPHISHAFSSSTLRIFRSWNHLIYVIDKDQTVIQRSSPLMITDHDA